MNMWKTLPVIAAFAFAHHVRAAVLVDLDATALAPGAISAWENKASAGGGLTNATPIRVEKIQNRAAADQENAGGQVCLGFMYEFGHGVVKDHVEAVKWYLLSGAQGHDDAKKGNLNVWRVS